MSEDLNEDMLRALAKQTAALPREIDPPADAWDRIKDAIEVERVLPFNERGGSRWWQRPVFLAAAGLTLVAGSSIVTAVVMNGRSQHEDRLQVARGVGVSPGAPQSLAQFTAMENDYIATANRFTEILESEHSELAPETVAKLKESLRVIDAAILEARRALAADPSNKALMEMLTASYTQKVDLLKRTTEMGQT